MSELCLNISVVLKMLQLFDPLCWAHTLTHTELLLKFLSITYFEITFIKILIIIFGIKDDIVSEYCKVAWAEPCFNNVTNVLIRVDIKMLLLRQELFFQCHLCCKYGSSGMSIAQLLNYPVIREKTLCSCIRLMLGPRGNNFFFLLWVLLFPSTCLSKHQDSRKTKLTSFPRDLISSVLLYSWTFTSALSKNKE